MNLSIRPYKPGDEESISKLLTRNTPYLRDHRFWVWINRILPVNPSLIAVIADKNNVIQGHTAIMPYEICVGEKIIKCGMSYHTLIDKDYRDQDLILPLLELADKLADDAGIEFHYGFPNKNARPIYKLPNHYKVEKFLSLEMDSCNVKCNDNDSTITFEPINEIDYSFLYSLNQVLDSHSKEKVEIRRNLQYYSARYFHHPQGLYKSYKIFIQAKFVGCLITKLYDKEDGKYFHIIDLLVDDHKIDYKQLFNAILANFAKTCDKFSFWKINENIKNILLEYGFQENGFDTFLGLCFLPNNKISETEKELLLDFHNWRLVMGDSDAF